MGWTGSPAALGLDTVELVPPHPIGLRSLPGQPVARMGNALRLLIVCRGMALACRPASAQPESDRLPALASRPVFQLGNGSSFGACRSGRLFVKIQYGALSRSSTEVRAASRLRSQALLLSFASLQRFAEEKTACIANYRSVFGS